MMIHKSWIGQDEDGCKKAKNKTKGKLEDK